MAVCAGVDANAPSTSATPPPKTHIISRLVIVIRVLHVSTFPNVNTLATDKMYVYHLRAVTDKSHHNEKVSKPAGRPSRGLYSIINDIIASQRYATPRDNV